MNNSHFAFAKPVNEPVYGYAPGSPERKKLKEELQRQLSTPIEIPIIIGGKEIRTGDTGTVVMPHNHAVRLATYHRVGEKEVLQAIETAEKAVVGLPGAQRLPLLPGVEPHRAGPRRVLRRRHRPLPRHAARLPRARAHPDRIWRPLRARLRQLESAESRNRKRDHTR